MKALSDRRSFMKWTVGILSATATTKAVAQLCGLETGKQPLGPFFPNAGTPVDEVREINNPNIPIHLASDNDLTVIKGRNGTALGQKVIIQGKILDQNCEPIENATIIIWQASSTGRYNHKGDSDNHDFKHPVTGEVIQRSLDDHFQSWGKAISNAEGEYHFKTIVPGFYPADLADQWYRPPHVHFLVMAKGYPQLVTQLYFKGEALENNSFIQTLNKKDYLLQSQSINEEQRKQLIVEFANDPTDALNPFLVGQFEIILKR